MDVTQCTVCESRDIVPAAPCGEYRMARCTSCAHRFVSHDVDERVLAAAYDETYYGGAQRDASSAGYADYLGKAAERAEGFRSRLHDVLRYTGRRGRILDFGCAVGLFVKVAKEEGWSAVGYERSGWAVEYGRRVFGVDIRQGTGDAGAFAAGSFDAVTLWDVIEHVEQPRSVMQLVRGWLTPGGIVALNTVNASSLGARLAGRRWRHLTPPHHLQFFTRRSVMRLLHDAGFRVLHVSSNGTCFEGTDGSPAPKALRTLDRLVYHWRLRPMVTALGLLDEIEVIAART
jgi:2-polyprenyl-3-methyl-5-hydroxy-6-metoxy-1,4-benzoquinol methylase